MNIDQRIIMPDGSTRWQRWSDRAIFHADGSLKEYQSVGRDVTDRKQDEEALRETNEYLHKLIDYASAPIIVWDPDFRITRFNHAFEHLTGRTEQEVIGQPLVILFPEESRDTSLALIKKTLEGERWESVKIPLFAADGMIHTVLWNSANILTADAELVSTIAQGIDITRSERAEVRIRWLASFPEMDPNPVIEMDAQGTITFANSSTQKTLKELGLPENPALFIPEDKEDILRLLRETDEPQVNREITLNNETFAENISLNRTLNVVRMYTLNITRQKRAEQERARFLAELEQKNAELERFTYTVSHDLKSPLITIRGFLGLLEEDALKADTVSLKKDLNRIKSATNKMEDLLRDLLALSRIGRIVSSPTMVAFTTIAEDAVELLEGAIQQREVTVEIVPDMPVVNVDRDRVREVVMNLVENAIKFMGDQPHPKIEIGVRYDHDQPVFFVKDNGIGIDPQYHKKIFGLFEKLSVNTEGAGTGLAIVQRIIEVHGCRIWVESAGANQGSTFYFSLPVVGADGTDTHKNEEKAE
ncbi:MAG: PAS domain S-box protein [Methanoregula sp.]|nr:PAS domain S-box protein [Methanoregula sp.]